MILHCRASGDSHPYAFLASMIMKALNSESRPCLQATIQLCLLLGHLGVHWDKMHFTHQYSTASSIRGHRSVEHPNIRARPMLSMNSTLACDGLPYHSPLHMRGLGGSGRIHQRLLHKWERAGQVRHWDNSCLFSILTRSGSSDQRSVPVNHTGRNITQTKLKLRYYMKTEISTFIYHH